MATWGNGWKLEKPLLLNPDTNNWLGTRSIAGHGPSRASFLYNRKAYQAVVLGQQDSDTSVDLSDGQGDQHSGG